MLISEGSVFFIIMVIGILQVRRTFIKDKKLNHLQKNFLLAASHELKTPLTSAKIRLQTLKKHELEEEKKNNIIQSSIHDINRLNKLVDKIMMAAQLEKQSLTIVKENVPLDQIIKERIDFWNELYPKRIKCPNKEPITIYTDPIALTSIIDNLLENALKYSEKEVRLHCEKQDDTIVLKIIDYGQGIPQNVQKDIFSMFYRTQNEEVRQVKGAGLGLYIVDNLVKELQGTISLKSAKGQTTFTVIIPS